MTRNVYFHSLIRMQHRLSKLFSNHPLVKAWGLPLLSITIGGEIEKSMGRNQLFPLMKALTSSLDCQGHD